MLSSTTNIIALFNNFNTWDITIKGSITNITVTAYNSISLNHFAFFIMSFISILDFKSNEL